jgi:pyruvate,water dikinase
MQGRYGPSANELAERGRVRAARHVSQAPPFLGEPPQPPPLDGLPPLPARMMRAVGTAIDSLFQGAVTVSEATIVRGIGASPGVYTGTARRIDSPDAFGRLSPATSSSRQRRPSQSTLFFRCWARS